MERLSDATADRLPAGVRRPGYDRSRLRTGILHLGVGAFHRCHQAEFAEDLAEAGHTTWGLEGINLRPPRISDQLGPQGGLYVRRLTAPGQTNSASSAASAGSMTPRTIGRPRSRRWRGPRSRSSP